MTAEARRPDPLAELAALGGHHAAVAAEAAPLGPKPGPRREEIADMKLPPPELLDELDNSKAAALLEPEIEDEPVTLDFFGDELPVFVRELRYPFVWRETGERVEAVEVHQLTTAEFGRLATAAASSGGIDFFELYGHMARVRGTGTRLPARLLRRLPAADGEPITDAAYDFLPPSFRGGAG